jgi:hypothetical protein
VSHEVGAVAHQLEDVVGVDEEVLTPGGRAAPVSASVEHDQAESSLGERSLFRPLLGAGGQRSVDEHDGLAVAPGLDVERRSGRRFDGHRRASRSSRRDGDTDRQACDRRSRREKNRVHIDIRVAREHLGHVVMLDPEGNEFCVA